MSRERREDPERTILALVDHRDRHSETSQLVGQGAVVEKHGRQVDVLPARQIGRDRRDLDLRPRPEVRGHDVADPQALRGTGARGHAHGPMEDVRGHQAAAPSLRMEQITACGNSESPL